MPIRNLSRMHSRQWLHQYLSSSWSKHRSFHASPRHQYLDGCISLTHNAISGLHQSTGLSWAVTLPLTALIIRTVVTGPLSVYTYKITQRRMAVQPLIFAWQSVVQRKVMQKDRARGPVVCDKLVRQKMREKTAELYRNWGTQSWKLFLPVLQLPVFLVVIETIRKMCGTHEGLLGLFARPWNESTVETGGTGSETLTKFLVPIEESLSNEGALWFPDLLMPDPLLALPFILSASMFANISSHRIMSRTLHRTPSKIQTQLDKILMALALAVGPATLALPSAMLVYWTTSSLLALTQTIFLAWYMPSASSFTRCKSKESVLGLGQNK